MMRVNVSGRRASVQRVLGGSWVVISGLISRVTLTITQIKGLITPLITTHEPPNGCLKNPTEVRSGEAEVLRFKYSTLPRVSIVVPLLGFNQLCK